MQDERKTKKELIKELSQLRLRDSALEKSGQMVDPMINKTEKNEKDFSLIFEIVKDIIYQVRIESNNCYRFDYVNKAFLEATGLTKEQVLNKKIEEVMPEPSLSLLRNNYRKAVKEKKTIKWEETSRYPSGVKVGEVSITPVFSDDGNCRYLVGNIYDITERVQSENKLRRQTLMIDQSYDSIISTNLDGNVTTWNEGAEKMFGYSAKEVLGKHISFIYPDDQLDFREREVLTPLKQKGKHEIEVKLRRKSGQNFYGLLALTLLNADDGTVIGMLGSVMDITEHKLAEEALRESEERYRSLFQNSLEGIGISKENQVVDANPALQEIFGYDDLNEFKKIPLLDHVAPESRDLIMDIMRKNIQGKPFNSRFEYRIIRKDGERRDLEISLDKVKLKNEIYTIGTFRDITDRKKADETLRESEEKYRAIVAAFDGLLYTCSQDYRIEFINQHYIDKLGFNPTGQLCYKALQNRDDPCPWCVNDRAHKGKTVRREVKSPRDGRWYYIANTPINHADGSVSKQSLIIDITERKQAEEALRESEERFRFAMNYLPGSVWTVNMDLRFTLSRGHGLVSIGLEPDQVVGMSIYDFFQTKDPDHAAINAHLRALLGEIVEYEYTHQGIDFRTTLSPMYDSEDKITGVVGIALDITERKQAEEALRRTQAVLEESQKMASIGGWSVDLITNENIWTDEVYRIHEIEIGEMPSVDEDLDFFPPEDRPLIQEAFTKLMQNGESYDMELPFVTAKGNQLWIRTMGKADFQDDKIVKVSGTIQDITTRKQAETALSESENKLRRILNSSPDAIIVMDLTGKIIDCNPATCLIHGHSREELIGTKFVNLVSQSYKKLILEYSDKCAKGESGGKIECMLLRKDANEFPADLSTSVINDVAGKPQYIMGITRDLTEQKKLETQLIHSQKMESVGRLAGGVAHDFNNLLTAIIGHSELIESGLKSGDPFLNDIRVIQQASDRAAQLTSQLLAFSRKQALQPKIVNLNQVIDNMLSMLKRIIGEDIDFNILLGDELSTIRVDPGQMEQVIVNLAVNARDAMETGGMLTIETRNLEINDLDPVKTSIHIQPGKYVLLSVSDTGSGMSEEVKANIFEPFFTTKEVGKGTGLGLSTVYGIISQSGGHIMINSEPRAGTTFNIYLPVVEGQIDMIETASDTREILEGSETILIVEDDETVRGIAVETLKRIGFNVIEASSGGDALVFCSQLDKPVDLVITDVIMPNMSGPEFIEKLKNIWPEFQMLYISGYSENDLIDQGAITHYLQKPFHPKSLALKVRQILDFQDQDFLDTVLNRKIDK